MGSGLATQRSEAGPRGERTRQSAKDLRTAGKRGRDPARDVDSALCLGIAQLWPGWQTFCQKPHKNNLKLYKELQKAEASLLLQIRTGRIGLASFLFRAGASDFPTPLCVCGQAEETAKHITSSCSLYSRQRQQVFFNPQDFTIISNPELLQKFLYWFMSLKRLNQFNLAFKLHYSQSNT